jgi:hypothetical protein
VSSSRERLSTRAKISRFLERCSRMLALFRLYDVRRIGHLWGCLCVEIIINGARFGKHYYRVNLRQVCSIYSLSALVRESPIFFARPLVDQILVTPWQELAAHAYCHFYCCEGGAFPGQFFSDWTCAQHIAADVGTRPSSLVFPCDQVQKFLAKLQRPESRYTDPIRTIECTSHPRYSCGPVGRTFRFIDAWFPVIGSVNAVAFHSDGWRSQRACSCGLGLLGWLSLSPYG